MTLRVLFLLMLCAWLPLTASAGVLPTPESGPVLRIQGSNTIGAALGPALVEGLMREQGLLKIHSEAPDKANELRVIGETVQGRRVAVAVFRAVKPVLEPWAAISAATRRP